jgi:predicted nuclease of predicted toxin-antitoxin system
LLNCLAKPGHGAVHTLERGLERAEDYVILDVVRHEQRIVVSGDTDFGALLALARQKSPSVILFRSRHH